MARFTQLPNELVMQIWSFILEPQDVESFALVSRRVEELSSPFVERSLLRKIFSEVRIRLGSNNGRAAELFRHMFSDPRIQEYIQDLETEREWAQSWESPQPSIGAIAQLQSELVAFAGFLENMPMERALKGVEEEKEGPFLAFQFKRLIMELRYSDAAQVHPDHFRKLDRLLFPSDVFSHGGVPTGNNYWENVKMSTVHGMVRALVRATTSIRAEENKPSIGGTP